MLPRPPRHSASNIRITEPRHSSSYGFRGQVLQLTELNPIRFSKKSALSVWGTDPRHHEPPKGFFPAEELPRVPARRRAPLSAGSTIVTTRCRDIHGSKVRECGVAMALFAVDDGHRGRATAQFDRRG